MSYPVNHVHIRSTQPRETANWYIRLWGATILEEVQIRPGMRTIRMALGGDTRLFISAPPEGETFPKGQAEPMLGLDHFGFDVPDIDKELERLEKENVPIRLGATVLMDGMKMALIEAPDDVMIELVEVRQSG
jgi:lactoylglutathione lyase